MPLLTRDFLKDIGVTLRDADYEMLADHFETTLYERIIDELIVELSPEQAAELARLQADDDKAVQHWLKPNVPDLKELVADEIDILLGEIAENSDAIGSR